MNTPANNFGWILIAQDELTARVAVRFSSKDGSAPPSLQVTFTPIPEPGTCALLAGSAAFAGVLWRRLRSRHVASAGKFSPTFRA
ncbi:MAG: PEP-CTERM sorting domain-containing protein [Opitutus sp.]|nr:PEP-CTERM sorting domain-containing protein [Opitutus sp.]